MTALTFFRLPLLLSLVLALLAGCASTARVEPARQFAAEASRDDSFSELTRRYRDTYRRELPYLDAAAAKSAQEGDRLRQASSADFLRLQQALLLYFHTLERLAGSDAYDVSAHVDTLSTQLQAWPDAGLDTTRIDAYGQLLHLIAVQAGAAARDAALTDTVIRADAPVQTLLAAMADLLRHYAVTDEQERKIVLGLFEINLPTIKGGRDRLLAALARVAYQDRRDDYARSSLRLKLDGEHLANIAAAHARLAAWLRQPGSEQARAAVLQANRQMRASLEALEQAR